MGVQANILVKIYFRENVVVTKNLRTRLGQQSTQLQFGMLFIIMQNLEIFSHGIFSVNVDAQNVIPGILV